MIEFWIKFNLMRKKILMWITMPLDIDCILKFEPSGQLTDVGFTLHENTIINLEDIERIDEALRARIKATFTGTSYLHYIALTYYVPRIKF